MKTFNLFTVLLAVQLTLSSYSGALALSPGTSGTGKPGLDASTKRDLQESVKKGLKFLKSKQEDDGSWQHYPAITALALSSYLRSGFEFSSQDAFIRQGFNYLISVKQKDGGVYIDQNANYNSAIVLMAFQDSKDLEYKQVIDSLEQFLLGIQFSETNGYTADSIYYGGVGYSFKERPDLSNVQWSLEALYQVTAKDIEDTRNEDVKKKLDQRKQYIDRALVFLSRCQNLKVVNDQPYSGDDGGFMYGAGISKAGNQQSYGSMTYAGLKSLIHARVSRNDPRVQAAFQWITENYTLDENPGMGAQGWYYYLHTLAKSLSAYGEETITDSRGRKHAWKEEAAAKLIGLQHSDGSWINDKHSRWMEDNAVLVTCYTILAIEEILKNE